MFGLIGPDGAGKTTLLRILCGLYLADAGHHLLAGVDGRKKMRTVRSFIGYMPQRFSLYPDLSVAENMRFFADLFQVPHKEREIRLQRLLEFSRLGPFIDRRAHALSGGMKQKLALSCTLIHTPKILLLDEPSTGVDPVSRREFWSILAELRGQGVTILVTTPYMDEAARCDRIAFIHKGKILVTDEPTAIPSLFKKNLLELHCRQHVMAARFLEQSRAFESVKIFGDRLHVSSHKPNAQTTRLIKSTLAAANIDVISIKPVQARIEDVFVELLQ
ncbi:ABC transporter ATP-binding protein [candidate division KSB1 bacterium]|nr:ABC transporter ATP-binding protein [candidate division KSB1 bacterium]